MLGFLFEVFEVLSLDWLETGKIEKFVLAQQLYVQSRL